MDLEEEDHRCKAKGAKSRSLCGGLLPVWFTTAFWVPAKPLHLRSMLSKLMRCTENCNACSQNWSTEWAQFFSMTMPNQTSHKQCFKGWTNWATKFCLICHIHLTSLQPTTTSSSNFLQGKHFHNQQEVENAFQEFTESQGTDFYVTGISILFSRWQKCVDCNGSYFD